MNSIFPSSDRRCWNAHHSHHVTATTALKGFTSPLSHSIAKFILIAALPDSLALPKKSPSATIARTKACHRRTPSHSRTPLEAASPPPSTLLKSCILSLSAHHHYPWTLKVRCAARTYKGRDEVHVHLLKHGFMYNYKVWTSHGEVELLQTIPMITPMVAPRDDLNPYANMVRDVADPSFDWDAYDHDGRFSLVVHEPSNEEVGKFYQLLRRPE